MPNISLIEEGARNDQHYCAVDPDCMDSLGYCVAGSNQAHQLTTQVVQVAALEQKERTL